MEVLCILNSGETKLPKVRALTMGHQRWDTRIWLKQVQTLKNAKMLIAYEVADGQGDSIVNGITIRDIGGLKGRGFWPRIKWLVNAVKESEIKKEEILHFHDPLFLPAAIWLKLKGITIIYDVHEDYPKQVKNWQLPAYIRYGASYFYSIMEWVAGKLFDGIITATPKIAERFPPQKTVVVQNFPLLSELVQKDNISSYLQRGHIVAYIGGISELRGIYEIVQAVDLLKDAFEVKLVLGGSFSPPILEERIRQESGWRKVEYIGWLDRKQVAEALSKARAGLVIIHPEPRYMVSYPVKMFEYMSAGLPVIASDFELWKKIINDAGCGLLVDPTNPQEIASAIEWIFEHPRNAEEMGLKGRKAVEEQYNWEHEARKLLNFYINFQFNDHK